MIGLLNDIYLSIQVIISVSKQANITDNLVETLFKFTLLLF